MTESFFSGAICMGFTVIALFFIRYWRTTGDRLFLFFSAAFFLLMTERLVRALFDLRTEWIPVVYLLRLAAFVLILAAIADKNRRAGGKGS